MHGTTITGPPSRATRTSRTPEGPRGHAPAPPAAHLHGRALLLARGAWLALAAFTGALYVASTWAWLGQLRGPCPIGSCPLGPVSLPVQRTFGDLHLAAGLSGWGAFYGWYALALNVLFAAGYAAIAALLFWRRSRDPLALFVSLALLLFGVAAVEGELAALQAASPGWWQPVALLRFLGVAAFGVFLYVFPDGRFVPRWTRLAAGAWVLWMLPEFFLEHTPFSFSSWPGAAFFGAWACFLGTIVAAQVYRYRRVSTPAQRQQTKWVVLGVVGAAAGYFGGQLVLFVTTPALTSAPAVLANLAGGTLICAGGLLVPLCIGIAILRHHLFDIDLIIRRTLVYTILVAVLALLYEGGTLLIQQVLLALTGQSGLLAVVAASFGVGTLAEPVRRRIERGVSRVLYARKYEAERRIEEFTDQVRRELHLVTVPERLEETLEQCLARARAGRAPPPAHQLEGRGEGEHAP